MNDHTWRQAPPPIAPVDPLPPLAYTEQKHRGTMPFYLVEGGTEDLIRIEVSLPAGSRHEHLPLLAQCCGSMLREGTTGYRAAAIAAGLDQLGAETSVEVGSDDTTITLMSLGRHLPRAIDIFTDVLLLPLFPGEELAHYKHRARAALAVNLDKVSFQARLGLNSLLFGESPYRMRISEAAFDRIESPHLQQFFERHFAPEAGVAVLAGRGVERASELLRDSLERKMEQRRGRHSGDQGSFAWQQPPGLHYHKHSGALQSAISMGAPIPERSHPSYPALYVARMALGGYFGSRLMQNLRETKGYTYGIGATLQHQQHAHWMGIHTSVGAADTQAAINEITAELQRLAADPPRGEELALVKNTITGNLLSRFDGVFSRASRLSTLLHAGLAPDYYSRLSEDLQQVTTEAVAAAAEEYFKPEAFSLAVAGHWAERE